MFQLVRTVARVAVSLVQRFYLASPANPYEALLFSYLKATIAHMFFREAPSGVK